MEHNIILNFTELKWQIPEIFAQFNKAAPFRLALIDDTKPNPII
jgi:hypothetical protein